MVRLHVNEIERVLEFINMEAAVTKAPQACQCWAILERIIIKIK
jgi:hypothetical protein